MKTDELKIMIETAEALGHKNIDLVIIEQGRDGDKDEFHPAKVKIIKTGDQREEYVAIGFTHT